MSRYARAKIRHAVIEALEDRRLLTTYYISPFGSDANPGTSTAAPWMSVSRIMSQSFNGGDSILLQGGYTFNGTIYLSSDDTGSAAAPILVSTYGTGRASVNGGSGSGFYAKNTAGIKISNVNFYGSGASTNQGAGITFLNDLAGGVKRDYIRIEDSDIAGFENGISIGGNNGASGFRDVWVTSSWVHENARAGLFTFGPQNNVHEKIYVAYVNAYNNFGVAGDAGVSGHGILLGSVNGGTVERCIAHHNGASGNGGAGIWAYDSTKITFQFNESYSNKTGGPHDGDGFDLDRNTTYSVMQYNYSHDNDGAGYLMATPNGSGHGNNIVRYNISQNDCRKLDYGALHIWGKTTNAEWYNNTVYLTPKSGSTQTRWAIKIVNDYITSYDISSVHFRNNIIQTTGSMPLMYISSTQLDGASDVKFQGNAWYASGATVKFTWGGTTYSSLTSWRSATGQETVNGASAGFYGDPMMTGAGAGGTIGNANNLSSLSSYKLQSGSPLINSGLNLKTLFNVDPGTKDYWGTSLPQGGYFDIGANEAVNGSGAPPSPPPPPPPPGSPPPPPPPPSGTQTPYLGSAFSISTSGATTIQAEDFDNGGEGVAYHDSDTTNSGTKYRTTGVDIETTSGGYNVGYTKLGEWLEYTVNVAAGSYDLTARVASLGTGGNFRVEFGGVNKTGSIAVPNTNGWQTFTTTAAKRITLSAGAQVMRVYFESNGSTTGATGNLDWIKLTPATSSPPPGGGTTTTLTNSIGTYAQDGSSASSNFGSASTLQVKKSTSGFNRESYLKFDLSSISAITSAKLRLYGNLSDTAVGSLATSIYSSTNTSWDENTLTWNSRPTAGSQVGSITVVGTSATWYEVDLTAFLQAEKAAGRNTVTLVLRNTTTSSTLTSFNSDDAASNKPQLVVTT